MKRCPECRRDYYDDTLLYCLDDGAHLLEGPASAEDRPTAIFPEGSPSYGGPQTEKKTQVLADKITFGGRKPGYKYAIGLVLIIVVIGTGWALWKYFAKRAPDRPDLQSFALTRVTTSGRALQADISPDGKFVVYLETADDGNRSLWVKQLATGNSIPIVAPTKGNVLKSTTFSRDGNFVYYLFTDRTRPPSLYQVSSVGGTPRKVIDVCPSPVGISADGQKLAFLRYGGPSQSSIVTTRSDGSDEKVLASLDNDQWFTDTGASWSPDGKTIAVTAGIETEGTESFRLLGIDTSDGSIRDLSSKRWSDAGRVVWTPDGGSVLLLAKERMGEPGNQLWQVEYPSGSAVRLTNDVQPRDDTSLGITADGRQIVTVTQQRLSRIETVPYTGQSDRPNRISQAESNIDGLYGLDILTDGRIVFASSEGGQEDIWIMNADGSGRRKLTADEYRDGLPTLSPDDRSVVFMSNRPVGDGAARLWRMNIDGSELVQLAARADSSPSIAPDGQSVIFSSWSPPDKKQLLWKVPINGGEPVKLTDYTSQESSFSPDGKWIGSYYADEAANKSGFGILPAEGGGPIRHFDFPGFQYEWVRWTPDGRNLSFIGAPPDPSNIWLQSVEGGEPRKLTDFKTEYIYRHEWSRDGKTLYLVRGRPSFDVVLQTAAKSQ